MLRTTIDLDEETANAVRHLADAQQRSQAKIIRDALRSYRQQSERQPRRPAPAGVGAYRSGRRDVSEQAENLLGDAARKQRQ